jgi:hypothetical protein
VPDDSPEVVDIIWTKDDKKIDVLGSGGKYTGGSIADPSLTIKAVNSSDKGRYVCCASNSVGNMHSKIIQLGRSICTKHSYVMINPLSMIYLEYCASFNWQGGMSIQHGLTSMQLDKYRKKCEGL